VKRFYQLEDLSAEQTASSRRYLEFLHVPAMSAGLYVLPANGRDEQKPHQQDEMYYVVRGRARMQITRGETSHGDTSEDRLVKSGTVIFVEAGTEHRFHSIEEELVVLVFFAPAETE
jgi:mannose-6-phosphate isomerase-like protein (cupin superfamily)